jgi:hypothetical protein
MQQCLTLWDSCLPGASPGNDALLGLAEPQGALWEVWDAGQLHHVLPLTLFAWHHSDDQVIQGALLQEGPQVLLDLGCRGASTAASISWKLLECQRLDKPAASSGG